MPDHLEGLEEAARFPDGARDAIPKSAADMKRCQETPEDEWGGHKGIFLANQEGFLGGFAVPLLNALEAVETERDQIRNQERQRIREALLDEAERLEEKEEESPGATALLDFVDTLEADGV
jgi:hypothetical protein